MILIYRKIDGRIRLAIEDEAPRPPLLDGEDIVSVAGSAERDESGWRFAWPHRNGPSSCRWDGTQIVAIAPAPPLASERIAAEIAARPAFAALVRWLAKDRGLTEAQLRDALVAEMEESP